MHILPDEAQVHIDGLGLNDRIRIYADDRDPDAGNASHRYLVLMTDLDDHGPWPETIEGGVPSRFFIVADIQFQHRPRLHPDAESGVTEAVLLAIVRDRLRGFQAGPFACRENEQTLLHVEEAHHWSQDRAWRRKRQGVLGRNLTHES